MIGMKGIYRKDLARVLLEIEVVKFGSYRLKDGSDSPIYLSFRVPPKGPLTSSLIRQYSGELLWPMAVRDEIQYDAVCGVPEAGDPFTFAFADIVEVPQIWLAKEGSGEERRITGIRDDGGVPRGKRVLVIDDLITRARSKIEAVKALRDAGYIVTDVLVLVDREQGGREELQGAGLALHAVWKLTELLEFYRSSELLKEAKYKQVMEYLAVE